ncbi:2Fe-2S iron-sulfur cluster binding domain-containing protein (plasmid) [Methylocystis sp. MJC1]|jgi:ferredoxin-NADP reductase/ferredoxin|uniref:2Fe-2S iron-sulfur cluster-binding protein n=1 Tax=Methylocystis sp. MJC1 TaxID=2654282 RepID=UPI0013ED2594|nr:2Fe-2S iron-sulfur cluster binding domain-containing protein [Methylocystis sp. MJC1]KAF2991532.1 Methane monooxygenase component C [Methylocystis sp. MJC1]MBU6529156.1 2Fe-2S iron-sulfur cluster binding domain-containing protein [Methylocystis sp. MJC1]UZX13839.1 2Fe-2S iron-sulfur cluster binding domain-containing protein [Methylocystis sp. MJC1]
MFKVSLITRDGAAITFDAEPSETLLDAAERSSIYLPSSCREGGCGACRVGRDHGDVELLPYSGSALSDVERDSGDILLCRAQARSDLALHAPFDQAAVGYAPIPERRAVISEIAPAGSGAVRLVLQYEDNAAFGRAAQFTAGQFVELSLPDGAAKRSYSLANTPNWDGTLEFYIRLQPNGAFSSYLKDRAALGDTLLVRGPQGQFTADEASAAERWFVAGGTGLAPALSMLRQMAEFGDGRGCRLFFGVNRVDELFALDVIEDLKKALPQLIVTTCVWKPEAQWEGFVGTPAQALTHALTGVAELPDIYVCGPPPLIAATESAALAANVAHTRIFSERFTPA